MRDPVVWVLDENARRSAPLAGADAPSPVLYAFDGDSLDLLWKSAPGQLHTSGKCNEPVFANGTVVVGTDRIQAFGPDAPARVAERAMGPKDVSATPASGGANPGATAAVADSGLDGATLFKQRCAVCMTIRRATSRRSLLESRSRAYIVDTLTDGAMRAQAARAQPP